MTTKTTVLLLSLALVGNIAAAELIQLETPRDAERDQRREFPLVGEGSAFQFRFKDVVGPARIDNAAVLQLQVDKIGNKFLSTLPGQGSSQFLTVLKPCGILLPHEHQRATEFYSVISGTMDAGIAQENGALQNITFKVQPGEVFVVPQGLLHYNHNRRCTPNAFFQSFNSADSGALNVITALASLGANPQGAASIAASTAQGVQAARFGAFELDKACLKRCGFPETGAPGNGLQALPAPFKALFGL